MFNTQAWDSASLSVRSFKVGCAVTHTITGKNDGDYCVSELEVEDIERLYVRDAKTMRDYTGTTPGAEEARLIAACVRVNSAILSGRTIGLIRLAYPWGLPTTDCMLCLNPAVSMSTRASWRL